MQNSEYKTKDQIALNDEIDLVDLFLILWNRKLLIGIVFSLCVIIGFVYCFVKVDKYKYVTTFEIGSLLAGAKEKADQLAVESPDIVKVKLDQVYIPQAVKVKQHEENQRYHAQSNIQKNSNIILISSVGTAKHQNIYESLHNDIVGPIIENHQTLISTAKHEYEILAEQAELKLNELLDPEIYAFDEQVLKGNIRRAEAQLVKLNDEKSLLEAKKVRLKETYSILSEQINKIEKNLLLAYANRPKATSEVDDEAKALTFLMLNSQIEQNESNLVSLKERANVQIENQKQLLDNQLAENRRNLQLQKDKVGELQSSLIKLRAQRKNNINKQNNVIEEAKRKIRFYQDSQVLGLAQRSLEKEGPGKTIILALSIILGVMGGVIFAFVTEFMIRVRKQKLELEKSC